LTAVQNGPEGPVRSDKKNLSMTPIWSFNELGGEYLRPPDSGNANRNTARNLSLTPSMRSACRKSTGGSFMGTYSSINIRYVPTNMYKQGSAVMGSKFEADDEKGSNSV